MDQRAFFDLKVLLSLEALIAHTSCRFPCSVVQAKMEISKEESYNPIKQDIKKVRD